MSIPEVNVNIPSILKDYDLLSHKPQINGISLSGNMTSDELGIHIPEEFVVTFSEGDTAGTYTCDRTYEEITAAVGSGNFLRAMLRETAAAEGGYPFTNLYGTSFYAEAAIPEESVYPDISFYFTRYDTFSGLLTVKVSVNSDNVITKTNQL